MTPEMNRERAINLLNEFGLPLDEERITMIGDFLAIWIGWELTGVQQPAPALEPNWENVGYEIKHKIAAHKANHGGDQPSNLDMGAIAERAIRVSSCVQQPATEPDEPADSMQGDVDDERSALLVKAIKSAPKNATWMAYLIHGFDAALALRDVPQGPDEREIVAEWRSCLCAAWASGHRAVMTMLLERGPSYPVRSVPVGPAVPKSTTIGDK